MKKAISCILLVILVSSCASPQSSAPLKSPCACDFEYVDQRNLGADS